MSEWPDAAYWEAQENRTAERVADVLFCWQYGDYWEYQDWVTQAEYLRIALDVMEAVNRFEAGCRGDAP